MKCGESNASNKGSAEKTIKYQLTDKQKDPALLKSRVLLFVFYCLCSDAAYRLIMYFSVLTSWLV